MIYLFYRFRLKFYLLIFNKSKKKYYNIKNSGGCWTHRYPQTTREHSSLLVRLAQMAAPTRQILSALLDRLAHTVSRTSTSALRIEQQPFEFFFSPLILLLQNNATVKENWYVGGFEPKPRSSVTIIFPLSH